MSHDLALPTVFIDRNQAGRCLVEPLARYAGRPDVIVLALPRGGVPVAYEVATALNVRLDLLMVRKLGMPFHPEFAMGAIASGGVTFLNDDILRAYPVDRTVFDAVVTRESEELARRERAYRGGRPALQLKDQVVILINDGLATGATMRAAIRLHEPSHRRGSWSPFRSHHQKRSKRCTVKWMSWCARGCLSGWFRLAIGTRISRRRRTRKS